MRLMKRVIANYISLTDDQRHQRFGTDVIAAVDT